jgi:hypothetical protein
VTRRFTHHDGSRCRLQGDVWVIEKVHTPKLGVPYNERIGDPCPYCNRFKDGTVVRGGLWSWIRQRIWF